jgi:hypothetical protein
LLQFQPDPCFLPSFLTLLPLLLPLPPLPQVVDYSIQDVAEVYKEAPFDIAIDCMGTRSECARPQCIAAGLASAGGCHLLPGALGR